MDQTRDLPADRDDAVDHTNAVDNRPGDMAPDGDTPEGRPEGAGTPAKDSGTEVVTAGSNPSGS